MVWSLDNNRPIYLQLMEKIQMDIISGRYSMGEKLPSVRELAVQASVNPNTMQKALSELERSGFVHAQRTSGRFITEDEELLKERKMKLAKQHVETYFLNMNNLGFAEEAAYSFIKKEIGEGKEK